MYRAGKAACARVAAVDKSAGVSSNNTDMQASLVDKCELEWKKGRSVTLLISDTNLISGRASHAVWICRCPGFERSDAPQHLDTYALPWNAGTTLPV